MRRILKIVTRSRYAERGNPGHPASVVVYPEQRTVREFRIEGARRFKHRNPRLIPNGLSFESDVGCVQYVTVEENPW